MANQPTPHDVPSPPPQKKRALRTDEPLGNCARLSAQFCKIVGLERTSRLGTQPQIAQKEELLLRFRGFMKMNVLADCSKRIMDSTIGIEIAAKA